MELDNVENDSKSFGILWTNQSGKDLVVAGGAAGAADAAGARLVAECDAGGGRRRRFGGVHDDVAAAGGRWCRDVDLRKCKKKLFFFLFEAACNVGAYLSGRFRNGQPVPGDGEAVVAGFGRQEAGHAAVRHRRLHRAGDRRRARRRRLQFHDQRTCCRKAKKKTPRLKHFFCNKYESLSFLADKNEASRLAHIDF